MRDTLVGSDVIKWKNVPVNAHVAFPTFLQEWKNTSEISLISQMFFHRKSQRSSGALLLCVFLRKNYRNLMCRVSEEISITSQTCSDLPKCDFLSNFFQDQVICSTVSTLIYSSILLLYVYSKRLFVYTVKKQTLYYISPSNTVKCMLLEVKKKV